MTVKDLEENSKFKHSSMREAIHSLLNQTSRATKMIQKDGPELISSLTEQYVTETIDTIDDYVARVIDTIEYEVKHDDLYDDDDDEYVIKGWVLCPTLHQLQCHSGGNL